MPPVPVQLDWDAPAVPPTQPMPRHNQTHSFRRLTITHRYGTPDDWFKKIPSEFWFDPRNPVMTSDIG